VRRTVHRRLLLASLTAAALAPRLAHAATHRYPLADAFLLLDQYLALPQSQRDRFYLAYRAVRGANGAPDAQATIIAPDGTRTPVALDADGFVTETPTLAQLKSRAVFETEGAPFKIGLEVRARIAAANRLEAAELALSIAQVNAAVAVFAGGESAGRFTTSYFPGADSGRAILGDGRTPPLPIFDFPGLGPIPYFDATKLRGAMRVELAKSPSRILFGGPPHKA
jgi:hypothetical protein